MKKMNILNKSQEKRLKGIEDQLVQINNILYELRMAVFGSNINDRPLIRKQRLNTMRYRVLEAEERNLNAQLSEEGFIETATAGALIGIKGKE
jgi:hypothetical protein